MPITDAYVKETFAFLRGVSPTSQHTAQKKAYETGFFNTHVWPSRGSPTPRTRSS